MNFFKKIVSILISVFFIYLCINDIPINSLFKNIQFYLGLLIFAIILLFLINILKAFRLKILLTNYKNKKLEFYLKPILLRQFLNSAFIGNLGEFAVPYVFKKYLKISYSESLSLTIIERILDLTFITLIFGITLFFNDLLFDREMIYIYFSLYFFFICIFIFIVNSKKKIFLIPKKIINQFKEGYKKSISHNRIFIYAVIYTVLIWLVYIFIDCLIFYSFDSIRPIFTIPNIIFITGVILVSQLIPSAPASIGVFNYFVIKTIEIFYETMGLSFDLQVQSDLTSISIIILLIYILPDITWGAYYFYKELNKNMKKFFTYINKYMK